MTQVIADKGCTTSTTEVYLRTVSNAQLPIATSVIIGSPHAHFPDIYTTSSYNMVTEQAQWWPVYCAYDNGLIVYIKGNNLVNIARPWSKCAR